MITTWRAVEVAERVARGVDGDRGDARAAAEIAVSVRTRLPVASAARNSLLVIGPVVRAAERAPRTRA